MTPSLDHALERVFPSGIFRITVLGGKSGHRVLDVVEFPNLIVNVGRTYISGSALIAVSPVTSFYLGIMSSTPTIAASDTMASHAGWTELTGYSNATRPTWVGVAGGTAGSLTNTASPGSFSINAGSQTLGGAFLTTSNTKGGSTGTLIAAGSVTSTALSNPSSLLVTYDFAW